MPQPPAEYLVIDEVFDVPIGLSIFGHSPRPDTPWPRPGEVVELHASDGTHPGGSTIQVLIMKIDEAMAQVPGGNPATRAVLIPKNSVQTLTLAGFRITPCHKPSPAMLEQQRNYQSATAQSRQVKLIWLLVALAAVVATAAACYALR